MIFPDGEVVGDFGNEALEALMKQCKTIALSVFEYKKSYILDTDVKIYFQYINGNCKDYEPLFSEIIESIGRGYGWLVTEILDEGQ